MVILKYAKDTKYMENHTDGIHIYKYMEGENATVIKIEATAANE